jgi:hypothetical protein
VNGRVNDAGLASDVVVGHAVPGGSGLRVGTVCGQVGEIDVLVGIGRTEVDVECETALVGLRFVGLLAVEHNNSLQVVVSVHGVRTDTAVVRSANVLSTHAGDLGGSVAVADDGSHGSVGIVESAHEGSAAVHLDRLPSTGVRVVGHVHLYGGDVEGGGIEQEVEGPERSTEGIRDTRHTNRSNGAHFTKDVRQAGLDADLDLLLPVCELGVSLVELHEVVKRDRGSSNTND